MVRASAELGRMDEVELANLVAGISGGPVDLGLLESILAARIGANRRRIWLSGYTVDKNRYTHPDILYSDYKRVPVIHRRGFAAISPDRPRHLVLVYRQSMDPPVNFKLVLKASRDGESINVETYHRVNKKEFARLIRQAAKRGTIVRNPYPDILERKAAGKK